MRYVFFGTPDFAAIILEKLVKAGLPPVLVVCNPDRPVGRKKIITPPPVKQRIMNFESGIRQRIKIIQPEKLDPSLFLIPNSQFDFFIIAAYAKILPKEIIDIPRLGAIGVHPSLLPKYRGATPIQSVILNGEKETGVTLFLIDEKIDHGKIVASSKQQVSSKDNYESLIKKMAELAADLLIKTLPKFLNGEITPETQNENEATYTKKLTSKDAYVDLEKDDPLIVERKVRALNPEPGVWSIINGKRTKILETEIIDGKLKLKKIQVEGKRPQIA